ncbi:MAG: low molecular weight protein-tyrosine-phosphatase [Trueperaceae bacterium]|nr:low molecular weight protein-tyrosine-phosphatase [Trueperaceae bacterium]
MPNETRKILFICTGNICRSPTAEGVFRALLEQEGLAEQVEVDSAGTTSYHVGSPPDPRTQAAARRRDYDLSAQRARQIRVDDCRYYDYLIVMDSDNYERVRDLCADSNSTVKRFLEFAPDTDVLDVPDPYYGGEQGFERVLDLIEAASRGLLNELRTT